MKTFVTFAKEMNGVKNEQTERTLERWRSIVKILRSHVGNLNGVSSDDVGCLVQTWVAEFFLFLLPFSFPQHKQSVANR